MSTDKPSYPNRDLVHVTGAGYAPGCDVTVRIVRPDGSVVTGDGSETPGSDTVTTGADGSVAYDYRLGTVDGTYWVYVVDPETNAILAMTTFADAATLTTLKLHATGVEDYVYTAGDQIDASGSVSNSKHYQWTVVRSDGTQRVGPCTATSSSTTGGSEAEADSYTVTASDPASTATLYTYKLSEFGNADATCSSPNTTATLQFAVVKATSYADSALTTPRSAFGAGATAYLRLDGLTPGQADWSTTWVTPTGSATCANTTGTDRPDSSAAGRGPDVAGSFLQYQPGASGDPWNLSSNFDAGASCPPLTGNDGLWRLRLQRDATHFVDLGAFTAATTPPDTTITSGPSGTTTNASPSVGFSSTSSGSTFMCKLDGPGAATGSYASCSTPKAYTSLADGDYTFSVYAVDSAGNVDATPATRSFTVDTTPPAVTLTTPAANALTNDTTPALAGAAGNAAGDGGTVTVNVYAGAGVTGLPVRTFTTARSAAAWSIGDADWDANVPLRAPLADGVYTVQAQQSDAGGPGFSNTRTFRVDATPPVTTDNVPSTVQASPITVTLSATDASAGVDKTYYTTDDSDPTLPSNPSRRVYDALNKPVLQDGQQIRYYSVDLAGNAEAVKVSGVAKVDSGSSLVGVDGNQDNGSGTSLTGTANGDWQAEWLANNVVTMPDRNDLDLGFGGGTKETEPYNWAYTTTAGGVTPAKSNIQAAWAALEATRSTSFLYLAFKREGTTGNTFLDFELNQGSTTYVNATGTVIPCRHTGDLLVSFETGNPPTVHVYKWVSTTTGPPACPEGAIGNFVSAGELPASEFQARMNTGGPISNYLASGQYGTTFPANSFGEAALDLPKINQALNGTACSSFVQIQVHSRSSESIGSQLQDYVLPAPMRVRNCSVSGTKFDDQNANGVRDSGEPGAAGFKVYVDLNGDGSWEAGEPYDVTAADGSYYITSVPAGTYEVREALTPSQAGAGWTCSKPSGGCHKTIEMTSGGNASGVDFGNWLPATVSGTAWEDVNRNGIHDAAEAGLAGTTVFVDYNGNGLRDAGEPSAVSGADGSYSIAGVKPGAYTVRQEPRAGYVCTYPAGCAYANVTLVSGGAVTERDFGDSPSGRVSGVKFEDSNANGVRDPGEPGLGGWTVYVDYNGNATLDAGEPSAVTAADGTYSIPDVRAGSFRLREVGQSGWTCSEPAPCYYPQTFGAGTDASGKDFGAWRGATVAGTVFGDANQSGARDAGEVGLGGWTVYVDLDGNGVRDAGEPSATTAADGSYTIAAVKPGTYAVRQESQPGWYCTAPAGCAYSNVGVTSGASVTGADFGDAQSTTVSGSMFDDQNADGARTAGEPGLAGWTVYVDYNGDGTLAPTEPRAVTDANGDYTISRVTGNSGANPYVVRVVPQAGWTCSAPAPCSYGGFVIPAGASRTGIDFGAYEPSSISGISFEDSNANGVRDPGEPAVAGSTVWVESVAQNGVRDPGEPYAVTDARGDYTIAGVPGGSYTLREAPRSGWTCSATAGDANGCHRTVSLTAGATSEGNDFGSWRPASVSGTSFDDANRNGSWDVDEGPAAGATVFVDLNGNGALDPGEPSTGAGADGSYTIGGLAPRATPYSVVSIPVSGWTCTAPAGCAHSVTLASGDAADGLNFGSVPEAGVSGRTFEDLNANGTRDAGEPGLGGWTVYVDYNGDGARGPGEPSAVTDANGDYSISRVLLGSFHVREEPQSGWTCSSPAGCSSTVAFTAGTTGTGNFGEWQPGTVSGSVFEDSNRNAARDGGEPALSGWTVFVDLNGDGERQAGEPSATTSPSGSYTIAGVDPGTWTVREELQGDYSCTTPSPCEQAIDVRSGRDAAAADFGNGRPGGTIEGSVFDDKNADGAPRSLDPVTGDPLEPGLAGREVWLETVADNGVIDPGEPTAVTSALGDFDFRNLNPGTYKLRQVGEPGWTCSYPSQSDANGCYRSITVGAGETASAQDFGDWASPGLSGRTYEDLNTNGTHDVGEPYVNGWRVYLDMNDNGSFDAGADPYAISATAGGNDGTYSIAGIVPDGKSHQVREEPVAAAAGSWHCTEPAGGTGGTDCSRAFQDDSNASQTGDFGNYRDGSITGTTFEDLNANGIRDAGEPGNEGRAVHLDPGTPADASDDLSATAAADGSYAFTGLLPGRTYRVYEDVPGGWTTTFPSGGDYTVALSSGDSVGGRDFGSYRKASVSGTVFEDRSANGARDAGEPGISGRTVYVDADGSGGLSAGDPTTTTDSSGDWSFAGLDPGSYDVRVVEPDTSWHCSTPSPCRHAVGLVSGEQDGGNDFGSYQDVTLAGTQYDDRNGNGQRDPGEPGVGGRTITLDPGGATTTTAADGSYSFAGLKPGVAYALHTDAPSNWVCTDPGVVCAHAVTPQSGDGTVGGLDFGGYTAAQVVVRESLDPASDPGRFDLSIDGNVELAAAGDGDAAQKALPPGTHTVAQAPASGTDGSDYVETLECRTGGGSGAVVPSPGGQLTLAPGDDVVCTFTSQRRASVSGTVYEDLNADGTRDAGEPGISGRTVYVDADGSGDLSAGDPTTTTDSSGDWSFTKLVAGDYTFRTVEPDASWHCSAPSPCKHDLTLTPGEGATGKDFGSYQDVTVAGTHYDDRNGNGQRDPGEPGVGGRTITLDPGGATTTTAADGSYSFAGLKPGVAYTVTTDSQTNWVCTDPGAGCAHTVTPQSGDGTVGGLDFGGYAAAQLVVRETLDPASDPGRFDLSIDGNVELSGAGDGDATQKLLGPGSHTVAQAPASGTDGSDYVETLECRAGGGSGAVVPAPGGQLTLAPGDDVVCTFTSQRRASVSGTVYEDLNASGTRDAGEPGISGRTVYVDADGSGDLSAGDPTTTTDSSGDWSFTKLLAGDYTIRTVEPDASWHCSAPSPCHHDVTLAAGQSASGNDFGSYQDVTLAGTQYDDRNGNGHRDSGEPGVGGRTITLDPGGATTTTAADGSYSFAGLKPGVAYSVKTDSQAKWVCTDPGAGCAHTVTPQSGDGTVGGLDFGGFTAATLTIREAGDTGDGRFDLSIDGNVELASAAAGDGVQKAVAPGDRAVSQSPSAGTDGTQYDVTLECRSDGGNGAVVPTTNGQLQLQPGDDVVCTFTSVPRPAPPGPASVSGVVFSDTNGDGAARQAGEPPIAGAQVWVDVDGDGKLGAGEPHATTAADGSYSMTGLAAGHYVLRKAAHTGWSCTYPKGCAQTVDLAAGQHATGLDFGDHNNGPGVIACGSGVTVPIGSKCPDPPPPPPNKHACIKRPIVTWVRGHGISHVVFYLDGRRVRDVRHADRKGRWSMRFDRAKLAPGSHTVRARIHFSNGRKPISMHFTIRPCLSGKVSKAIATAPKLPGRCVSSKFRASVAGDIIRRVTFSLDGRRLKTTSVADWQGRYWVDVRAGKLARGQHVLRARMEFIAAAKRKPKLLELRFTRCGP